MAIGKVARYFEDKGYGFIRPDGESKDVFVHRSKIVDIDNFTPRRGNRVRFEIYQGPRGSEAREVIFLGENKPLAEPIFRSRGRRGGRVRGRQKPTKRSDRHGIPILPSDRPLRWLPKVIDNNE